VDTDRLKLPIRNLAQGELVGPYREERISHTADRSRLTECNTICCGKALVVGQLTANVQGLRLINVQTAATKRDSQT